MKRAITYALIFGGLAAAPAFAEHHEHGDKKSDQVRMADTNNDGEVSKAEFVQHAGQKFDKMDTNGDGNLDAAEIAACDMKHGKDYKKKDGKHKDDRNVVEKRSDTNHEQPDSPDSEAGPNLGGTEHNQTGGAPAGDNNPQN